MNTKYVTAGKPAVGGAVHAAPIGTTLPTDATTELPSAYKDLGYVSDEGVTNNNSPTSEDTKAWGGYTVMSTIKEKTDEFGITLLEVLNEEVIKVVYGEDNVSGSLSEGLTIKANANDIPAFVWVIDMVLGEDGVLKRTVIPQAKIKEMSEIAYNDSDAVGYGLTLNALADTSGNTHYEYLKG